MFGYGTKAEALLAKPDNLGMSRAASTGFSRGLFAFAFADPGGT